MTISIPKKRNKRNRGLILANLTLLALLAAAPRAAMAFDDRMAGSIPQSAAPKTNEKTPAEAPKKATKVGKKPITDSDNVKSEESAVTSENPTYKHFAGVDDRTAGSQPSESGDSQNEATITPSDSENNDPAMHKNAAESDNARARMNAAAVPVQPELPPVQTIPLGQLEYYGLLKGAADHSLGIDMWIGSSHGPVSEMLPQIPARSRYRTLDDLTERMLLTHTDAQYMGGGKSSTPGEDLMTLRLEKLIDIGAYDDAARLYALNPGKPYHEKLARAGVTAMLYSGRKALGCLEVKAFASSYTGDVFWQQLEGICDTFLSSDDGKNPQIAGDKSVFENSALLQKLVDKSSYKFRPKNVAEFEELTAVERLAVLTLQRVDYSKLAKLDYAGIVKAEPALIAAMLADSTLPDRLRFYGTLAGVATGAATPVQLTAFYESENVKTDGAENKSWKQLVNFYRQAKPMQAGADRDAVLGHALALRSTFGTLALLPFAPMIAEADPGNLTPESITGALAVMVKARTDIPQKWQGMGLAVISPQPVEDNKALTYLALDIDQNFKPLKSLEDTEFKEIFSALTPDQAKIVKIIYEKLDKGNKLHNIDAEKTYEKDSVLTEADDYVMPLSSLLEGLKLAQKDKRLGEVILISSILLRSTPAGTMQPEVLGEVLDGYKTVGLTREARDLAAEVVLGLRK